MDETNTNNDDQKEIVQAAGTEQIKSSPLDDDNKEEIMTIMLNANKNKISKDDMIPIQNLQPKQETKFFSPPSPPPPPPSLPFPLFPFPFKPKPERKLTFPSFGRFRPKFLPPVRNLLQSFRREESPFKLNPMDIFGAASFIRRILSTKLRILSEKYQPNIEEKIASMASPLFLLKESISPSSLFHSLPEPIFPGPLSHPFFLSSLLPPPPPPPLPPFLMPPFTHPFTSPPTPFVPLSPYHPLHPLPPSPMFNPIPYYHHLQPPPLMYHPIPPFPLPHSLPEHEPTMADHIQEMQPESKSADEEFIIFPSETGMPQFLKSEQPEYLFFYPNQQETVKLMPPKPKSLLDLLRPKSNRVHHVIQQTRIITQFKPDMLNQPELSNYHKPIMRIIEN